MALTFVVLPVEQAQAAITYAAQVDAALGLPSGVGTPAYTKTYAQPMTSFDGTQVGFLYDAITQPIIDSKRALAVQPLLASWFPPDPIWLVETEQAVQSAQPSQQQAVV